MLWYLLELANYYRPMVYYVRGGGGFSKRLDFGGSILKMHRIWVGSKYCKIPKISPRAYIFQRPFLRGLSTEGNLRFKIDWASLIVGRKWTVFALFYFVFKGNFQVQPPGGRFNRGFFALRVWGAYFWKTGILCKGYQTLWRLKQIHVSFKSRQKNLLRAILCQQQNVTRIKLGPGTYQLFLLPGT